jgi:hypothetical protein
MLAKRPRSSISFFEISEKLLVYSEQSRILHLPMMSGSLEMGTATSVDHTSSPSRRSASILHKDSLRADHSVFPSSGVLANSKSPLLCNLAIDLTSWMFSLTYIFESAAYSRCSGTRLPLPWYPRICLRFLVSDSTEMSCRVTYLKNIVGTSFHFLAVAPALLMTDICTSSMISIAATGTPARKTLEAAAAASRIVGNVTTATLVS